jgi:hypothetical protein
MHFNFLFIIHSIPSRNAEEQTHKPKEKFTSNLHSKPKAHSSPSPPSPPPPPHPHSSTALSFPFPLKSSTELLGGNNRHPPPPPATAPPETEAGLEYCAGIGGISSPLAFTIHNIQHKQLTYRLPHTLRPNHAPQRTPPPNPHPVAPATRRNGVAAGQRTHAGGSGARGARGAVAERVACCTRGTNRSK